MQVLEKPTVDNYSPSELLEIFPEAIPTIKEKLKENQEALQELENETKLELEITHKKKTPEFNEYIGVPLIKLQYENKAEPIQKNIKRLEHLIRIDRWKKKPANDATITDIDIARAKDIPLISFFPNVDRAGFTKCPFHNENTGSFKIDKKNRWHCYGACNNGGDVIDYVMRTMNIDFIKAVKFLIKR